MTEINEKLIQESFLGKPYKTQLTGDDCSVLDFEFQQFDITNLIDFQEVLSARLKLEDSITKGDDLKILEFTKLMNVLALPLVKKMV